MRCRSVLSLLLLACVGLYGVVSYETIRRTREIGIRMALGARRFDVLRLVMGQSFVVVTIGAGIGLGLALAASGLIRKLLFGVAPSDPLAIGSALAVLTSVGNSRSSAVAGRPNANSMGKSKAGVRAPVGLAFSR